MSKELERILLVEDSENDITLTLAAFEETNLANEVVVVRDGQEALDFLHQLIDLMLGGGEPGEG